MVTAGEAFSHMYLADESWPIFICLLGTFRVLAMGQALPLRRAKKTELLLGTLALRDQFSAPREALLEKLWPGAERPLADQSLNSLVHSLHKAFQRWLNGNSPVVYEHGSYRLNAEAGVGVDIMSFETWAKIGHQESQSGNLPASVSAYNRAADLYRGDLFCDIDVPALIARERLRAMYLTILARLADSCYAARDYDGCLSYAHRLLMHDPYREDAHRLVMHCHVRMGERAQALHQYRLCEQLLRAEYETAPEPATRALFDQVRNDSIDI